MIEFEKEVLDFLGLPSIPKKEFDGTPFDKGVAIIDLGKDELSYAVCSYKPEFGHTEPMVTKVFSLQPYTKIVKMLVVPDYMSTQDDINDMDLDEKSKEMAKSLLAEANEIENDDVEEVEHPQNEYYFDNINNDDEAKAFILAYNKRNKIRGRVPKTHENIVMRLSVIYAEMNKK